MDYLTLAYVLIGIGIFLLLVELVLLSGGVLAALGLAGMVFGVAMTFVHGDPSRGMIALVLTFIVVPVIGGFAAHYWPKTRMGRRFILQAPEDDDTTVAAMPVNVELEQLRG